MTEEEINKKAEKHCNEVLCNAHENCNEVIKCRDWRSRRAGFFCGYEQALKDFEKENAELKEKLEIEQNARGYWFGKAVRKYEQLTKAKELLERFLGLGNLWNLDCKDYFPLRKEAEQFLKGEFTAEQSNECHDCAKFDEMPKGPRCKTCDNGSHFQKKEEA